MNKIEKLKLYCTERLEVERDRLEAIDRLAQNCKTESDRGFCGNLRLDLRIRIVEIEGFLLLLEMDDPVWGKYA
jgi:hypothetical protein